MSSKTKKKQNKLRILFIVILFALFIFLFSVYKNIHSNRKIPALTYSKKDIAVRGNIFSNDNISKVGGFTIVSSSQIYKAIIDTRYLDPNKEELFINLFSIYSNIDKQTIIAKLKNQKKKGQLILSYNINPKIAAGLKILSYKLNLYKVFIPLKKSSSHIVGLDILISGDKRIYPYQKTLTPLLGFVKKYEKNKITRMKGVIGIEKYYDQYLNNYQDGLLKGEKDILRNIIFNKDSIIKPNRNGNSIKLNISLKLQSYIEWILTDYKNKFHAKEILVSIMNSQNGKILTLATSNRYNPKHIKQNELSYLNITAIESAFEPGSIIKPITMGLLFDKNKVHIHELINAHNSGRKNNHGLYPRGKYKIMNYTIGDDHRFKKRYITPTDIIVYSSNIGILQLAQRLKAQEFIDGFKEFGITKKTGVDLPYEKTGVIHTLKQYQAYEKQNKDNIYKATDSYGQGITTTFLQILKAYSVFNNNGKIVTPQIVSSIIDTDSKKVIKNIKPHKIYQVIKPKSAQIIKNMLIKTVKKGTGKATNIEGLEIGGKTGTSQIARKGKYQKRYISSFFGFVNDKFNHKYTIGVTVFEPSYKYHYAAQSAVLIYRKTIATLIDLEFLEIK